MSRFTDLFENPVEAPFPSAPAQPAPAVVPSTQATAIGNEKKSPRKKES
jgi:hypothetical protein